MRVASDLAYFREPVDVIEALNSGCGENFMVQKRSTVVFRFVVGVVISVGVVFYWVAHHKFTGWPWADFWPAFFDMLSPAFIISGILALTVDWYTKAQLLHEVSTDLIKHVVGFRQPEEVTTRIFEILRSPLIRHQMQLRLRFEPVKDTTQCRLHIQIEYEMRNISGQPQKFEQPFQVEIQELATIEAMRYIDPAGKNSYEISSFQQDPNSKERGVWGTHGQEIVLPPYATDPKPHKFFVAYSRQVSKKDFNVLTPSHPTIGIEINIDNKVDDLEFYAPMEGAEHTDNWWRYPKLFLAGETLIMRMSTKNEV